MNSSRGIDCVTFDVGGTLITPWPSVGHVYADVAARHGFKNLPAGLLDRRFAEAWRSQGGAGDTRAGWEEVVNRTFHDLIPTPTPFFAELYERFAEPGAWRVFDDVRPVLETLAAGGIRTAVISNWDERLRVLLRRLELSDCFETLIISSEVGCCKPSRAIFERAARQLALPPASILHIGDSLELDVRGAAAAGFHALHLRRDTDAPGAGEIRSLTELTASTRAGD